MPIQIVDPEKIRAVQVYLEQEFPNLNVDTFPELREDWQTYRLWLDVAEMFRVSVTYEFFMDNDDIVGKLRTFRLADELRRKGREPILVTRRGIMERFLEQER